MSQTSSSTLPRLNVTSLSQYVRLESCDRFLRQDEERALLKRRNLTIQPLAPSERWQARSPKTLAAVSRPSRRGDLLSGRCHVIRARTVLHSPFSSCESAGAGGRRHCSGGRGLRPARERRHPGYGKTRLSHKCRCTPNRFRPVAGFLQPLDDGDPLQAPGFALAAFQAAILACSSRRMLGSNMHDPFMALSFLALEVIPYLKLTDQGLVDVDQFKIVPLWVED